MEETSTLATGRVDAQRTKTNAPRYPFKWESTVPFFSNATPAAPTTQSWIGSGYQLVQVSPTGLSPVEHRTLEDEWMNLNPVTLISMKTEPLPTTFYDSLESLSELGYPMDDGA